MRLRGISDQGMKRVAKTIKAQEAPLAGYAVGDEFRFTSSDGLESVDVVADVWEETPGTLMVETEQSGNVFEVDAQTGEILRTVY